MPTEIDPDTLTAILEAAQKNPSGALLVFMVILGIGALRVAEAAVSRFLPASWRAAAATGHGTAFTEDDVHKFRKLYDMHHRYGADGQPLWYSKDDPKLLQAIATSLQSVAEVQRDTLRIVERIERRMDAPAA